MKKRLLSAALALAMVLTMLPLTAFADPTPPQTVYYYANGAKFASVGEGQTENASGAGWYKRTEGNGTDFKKGTYKYERVDGGVVNTTNATPSNGTSAKLYVSVDEAIADNVTQMHLYGSLTSPTLTVSECKASSVTINVNGQTLNFTDGSGDKFALTSVKVIDTNKDTDGQTAGDFTIKGRNFSFTNGDTNGSNAVAGGTDGVDLTLDNSGVKVPINGKDVDCTKLSNALTVNNYGGRVGNVTTKMAKANITVNQNGVVGEVKLGEDDDSVKAASSSTSKSGGSIKADDATVGDITVIGTVSITGTNTAKLGAIKVLGGKSGMNPTDQTKTPTWKGMDLQLDGYSSVTSVTQQPDDEIGHSVMLKGGSSITGDCGLNVGGTSSITLQGGSKISGNLHMARGGTLKLDNGQVGTDLYVYDHDSSKLGGAMSITVSKGSVLGGVKSGSGAKLSNMTAGISIDGGTMGAVDDGVKGNVNVTMTKNGGTVGTRMDEKKMDKSLRDGYEIASSDGSSFTYTTEFQDLIDAFKAALSSSKPTIVPVGDPARKENPTGTVDVTFQWNENTAETGSSPKYTTLTKITVTADKWITLPVKVQEQTVQYWYNAKDVTSKGLAAGSLYQVKESTTLQIKQVQVGKNLITKVSAKDADNTPIGCTLSGNTINLSGAVKYANGASMKLFIEIDGNENDLREVSVGWNKNGTINVGVGSSVLGVTRIADNKIKVYDTEYVITGSGLSEMKDWIAVTSGIGSVPVVVPSESAGLSGSYLGLGKEVAAELAKGTVDFSNADGLMAQLNSMINSLSQSTIDGYVKSACSAYASYLNKEEGVNTHKAEHFYKTYANVVMTPYFELSVSNYTPVVGKNPTFTLNITPKVKYTVRGASETDLAIKEKDKNGKTVPWSQVASLSVPNNDWGEVVITLPVSGTKMNLSGTSYAHHEGYVYPVAWNNGKLTTINGFSAYNFNNDNGGFAITNSDGTPLTPTHTFETIQDAVDAVKNGQIIECGENFNGSINVSGAARTFTIKAKGSKQVYLTAVNGANATYKTTSVGSNYTVQLSTDTAVAGSAAISVGTATNGTATVNLTNARAGSTVTITVNPGNGYRAATPTVKTNTGATGSVSGSGNTYTFTVPNGATSITVTPSFVQNTGLPFNDVAASAWYFDGVSYCYNTTVNGYRLLQGTGDTTYAPNSGVTRADVMQVLYNLAGRPTVGTARYTFTDVPSNQWYYNAVTWAANMGYAEGYGDGTFQPNRNVSRQELACFLHRYAGKPTVNGNLNGYSDSQGVASWAMAAMRWATGYSILSGTNSVSLNGRLDAYSTAYRSQVAVTLQRFHQYYK